MSANAMTLTTTTPTMSKKPCGCGGSGGSTQGCGCGCGGGCGCQSCQDVVYARPQFFAGQLLTEADLQLLGDYAVAKNRLHNRYLFGDGVVCGLCVTCPPCASGKVTVNPGYALDCCGNDIVVSCPVELDINQMVRQLMLQIRQADCGDPCAGTTNQNAGNPPGMAVTSKPSSPERRYCLYVDYCEQPSDAVAPYATGDTCGQATCEPTRIRENFRFELRCPEEYDCDPGAAGRFRTCVSDARTTERTVTDHAFLQQYLRPLRGALAAIREHPVLVLEESRWKQIKDRTLALKRSLGHFGDYKLHELDEEKLRPVLDDLLALASDAAQVWLQPDVGRSIKRSEIEEAGAGLTRAWETISAEAVDHSLHATLPRVYALALLQLSHHLALDLGSRQGEEAAADKPLVNRLELNLLAHRVVLDDRMLAAVAGALSDMRDWLQNRLERPGGTHCKLLSDVKSVTLQTSRSNLYVTESAINNIRLAGEILVPGVDEVLRACLCNALIPDCAACDDPGVLLACLTVEDCKVTSICNLDRKFVLTGPNLRYWFPPICAVGKALEEWCCPTCRKDSVDDQRDQEMVTTAALPFGNSHEQFLAAAMGGAPAYMRTAMAAILEPRGADRGPLGFLAPMFTRDEGETAAARSASVELQSQLQSALAEVRNLKREHTRLLERVLKLEKTKSAETK